MTPSERSGVAYAVTGFAVLSCGDAVVKSMAGEWPAYAVAALRFSIGALVLSALLWRQEGRGAFVARNWPLQIARGACLAFASVCFFSALYIMPMAEAMAIAFLSPILTQILAGPLLGEKVRGKVYLISLVALAGVAIILRPNLALLGWGALLPLVSAVFFALLMISNRASAGQGSALSMQVFVAAFCAPILILISSGAKLSGITALDFDWPSWDVVLRCAIVAATASTAHWLAYIGTSRAGAAQVAPAIYVQMLVVVILGWIFFDEVPDGLTLLGAGLIIAAGLYLWRDGLKPQAKPSPVPERS
ncbi:DMT family transporter [uncultured Erythrobacter sp.]|uniref:DMT family transporter n=1 Tax=uncultured Erythrobacter sp. TaxID=263913 RepID=UPI002629D487|nr:DMT family transporter [uncultured Erythrobacter sp.]